MNTFILVYKETKEIFQMIQTVKKEVAETENYKTHKIDFYNSDICGCYFENNTFYADENFLEPIADPKNYIKPEHEIEPGPGKYTLDEAAALLTVEVANEL